jgi:16S rRNA (adenine1518-N6/adenine1519-N6)-dimethyltransferase
MEYKDFKKKYGQNFIKDPGIIKKIVSSTNITKNDLVIEVGPGSGVLTKELSLVAKNVLCYEIDNSLEDVLSVNLSDCNNVEIIFEDFLKRDVSKDIEKFDYNDLYVVANIPYYITTDIIKSIINSNINPKELVLMIQKEVGDRYTSSPGSREYSSITVLLNYHFIIKKLFNVGRKNFVPEPKVDSVVISLKRRDNKEHVNEEKFNKIIRDSFKFKRKSIKNNLKGYDLNTVEEILKKHNKSLLDRAETFPLEVFIDLANNL